MRTIGLRVFTGVATLAAIAAAAAAGCGDNGTSEGSPFPPSGVAGYDGGYLDGSGLGSGDGAGGGSDKDHLDLDSACATGFVDANKRPVYMLILFDGSGSMDGWTMSGAVGPQEVDTDPAAPSGRLTGVKWLGARAGFDAFFDQLKTQGDPDFGAGLYLMTGDKPVFPPYPNPRPPPPAPFKYFDQWDVPIAFVDAPQQTALKTRLAPPIYPVGSTPLVEAMQGQIPLLQGFDPQATDGGAGGLKSNGKRVLVVVTDGVPNWGAPRLPDGGAWPPGTPRPLHECSTAAKAAYTSSDLSTPATDYRYKGKPQVTTFVVGVGNPKDDPEYDPLLLGELATAGGAAALGCDPNWTGNSPPTSKPCYFQITPGSSAQRIQSDLLLAMNTIRDSVASCEFAIQSTDGGTVDPDHANVIYTPEGGADTPIAKDATDGWSFDNDQNPTSVRLNGKSCDLLKQKRGKVRILLGCKTGSIGEIPK